MIGLTDLLIYLDEELTKNLNSLVIEGFIEKRTSKWIEDRAISGNIRFEDREQYYEEDRCIRDERDGYKGKNYNSADTLTNTKEKTQGIDGRRFVRREEELTRIYTIFEIHSQLINGLNESNILKSTSNEWINDSISVGDYIELNGIIGEDSVLSYIESCCDQINCIGCDTLNLLSKDVCTEIYNYNISSNYLTKLKDSLNINNTQDVIIKTNNNDIVLMLNNKYLFNNYGNIYERAGCPCKIIGKVIKVCEEGDYIHLLRKTGQAEFYENILSSHSILNNSLKRTGLVVPKEPKYKIYGKTLLVVPISISI